VERTHRVLVPPKESLHELLLLAGEERTVGPSAHPNSFQVYAGRTAASLTVGLRHLAMRGGIRRRVGLGSFGPTGPVPRRAYVTARSPRSAGSPWRRSSAQPIRRKTRTTTSCGTIIPGRRSVRSRYRRPRPGETCEPTTYGFSTGLRSIAR